MEAQKKIHDTHQLPEIQRLKHEIEKLKLQVEIEQLKLEIEKIKRTTTHV